MTEIKFKGAKDQPTQFGKAMGGRSLTQFGKGISADAQRANQVGSGQKESNPNVYGSGVPEANTYGSPNERSHQDHNAIRGQSPEPEEDDE